MIEVKLSQTDRAILQDLAAQLKAIGAVLTGNLPAIGAALAALAAESVDPNKIVGIGVEPTEPPA